MPRRKNSERNTRSLFTIAGGKSYALTLPIETVRAWRWDAGKELILKPDPKHHRLIIEPRPATR
jgi:hypothetical protein